MLHAFDGAAGPSDLRCSRAGCAAAARWKLTWRNPRIHSENRHKNWLACDAHLAYLREFLAARDFPLEVAALEAPCQN